MTHLFDGEATQDASCLNFPDYFFVEDLPPKERWEAKEFARSVCERCPLLELCLTEAITAEFRQALDLRAGMWGATTPGDRHRLEKGQVPLHVTPHVAEIALRVIADLRAAVAQRKAA